MKKSTLSLALALTLPATLALAQRPGGGPPPPPPPPPPPQQSGDPKPPPPSPLEHVLDADGDGIISAAEIENSPAALAKLDKNKDGKLTPNEYAPPRGGPMGGGDRPPRTRTATTSSDLNPPSPPFPGQHPPRDGDAAPAPKDGDASAAGPKDGDAPKAGPKDGDQPRNGPRDGDNANRPKQPPLLNALDTNHDGVISAEEIANAPKSLLTLDKNGDGQLGPSEYLGRPPGPGKDGNGPKPPRPPKDGQSKDAQ